MPKLVVLETDDWPALTARARHGVSVMLAEFEPAKEGFQAPTHVWVIGAVTRVVADDLEHLLEILAATGGGVVPLHYVTGPPDDDFEEGDNDPTLVR